MAIRITDPENTWSDPCIAGDGNGIIFSAVKCDKLSFRSYDFSLFVLVLKPVHCNRAHGLYFRTQFLILISRCYAGKFRSTAYEMYVRMISRSPVKWSWFASSFINHCSASANTEAAFLDADIETVHWGWWSPCMPGAWVVNTE